MLMPYDTDGTELPVVCTIYIQYTLSFPFPPLTFSSLLFFRSRFANLRAHSFSLSLILFVRPFFFHFYSTRLSPIPPFLFLFIYLSLNVRFFLPQVGDFFFYIKRKRSPLPLFFCFSFLFICYDFESSI